MARLFRALHGCIRKVSEDVPDLEQWQAPDFLKKHLALTSEPNDSQSPQELPWKSQWIPQTKEAVSQYFLRGLESNL